MTECMECGKMLRFFEGYRHPALGKKYLVCSTCFDNVYESVEKWRGFILPYNKFFNNKNTNHFHMLNLPKQLNHGLKMFDRFLTEKEI